MLEIIQGTDEWKALRLGKVTASRMADLMARTKSGWGASRETYRADLVVERLTGCPRDSFTSPAMKWGTETEPYARDAYRMYHLCDVQEIAFVDHPTIVMAGCSPDGIIGDDGLVELKCPESKTHIDHLLTGKIPEKYHLQMQWQLACCGRAWCDFASYDPRLPESMRLFIKRIPRDEALIAELEREVTAFLAEIDETVAKLRARYEAMEVAA